MTLGITNVFDVGKELSQYVGEYAIQNIPE